MPAGRPSKYKPEFCDYDGVAVVYGLCCANGNVFYVGQTRGLRKRIASYNRGHFHGNASLEGLVLEHGVNITILAENPADLNAEEMKWIQSTPNLVNIVTDNTPYFARSKKPWMVKGASAPTRLYSMHMRNAFGSGVKWLSDKLKSCSDDERMLVELRFADFMLPQKPDAIKRWLDGLDVAQ